LIRASCPPAALSRQIAGKRPSPVDAVEALLNRIEAIEPKPRAFVAVNGANAVWRPTKLFGPVMR
jgi:aspartyl-tRNA(Asn)/glutamyl-tRNA(Gln) amidotransferase subunit A